MERLSLLAFAASLGVLFLKILAVSLVQGKNRIATKVFRWQEDARAWGGRVAEGDEAEPITRAQAALRNDGETQPFYFAGGLVWIALGAQPVYAAAAFATYTALRIGHAYLMIRPRQPLRNRVYSASQLVLLAIVAHAVWLGLAP